jgi:hypothetical protein
MFPLQFALVGGSFFLLGLAFSSCTFFPPFLGCFVLLTFVRFSSNYTSYLFCWVIDEACNKAKIDLTPFKP